MDFQLSCPIPKSEYDKILIAHGGGGKLTQQLISRLFLDQFGNQYLNELHDGSIIEISGAKFAFTTDSYVVHPIFFPGGNIGELAINGTVNDLTCCGSKPLFISASFIIEEGFEIEELWKIVLSMKSAADKANVLIVTGDTKVVEKGKGDKIFINTSGIGQVYEGLNISPKNCKPGDIIILNGRIAEHGIAIMSEREGLEFETKIESDTAPLNGMIDEILKVTRKISVMRDPTRGGLASALNEIARSANVSIEIYEEALPISDEVLGACEILGLDPLYIANEGKILIFADESEANKIIDVMKHHPLGKESKVIGRVVDSGNPLVTMKTLIGSTRIVDMMSGEQLPRIC